jgi:Tol biopolymer transport system component
VTVQGNKAGTDASGTAAVPNGGHGILLGRANSTTVGGVGEGLGNRVAFNTGIGIAVAAEGTANSVRGNSVEQNGGLGIDIVPEGGPNGLTANDPFDADTGPNNLQNFPVLTAVAPEDGDTVSVTSQLDTPASTNLYTIDYYATAPCDGSDHGEGARHVGSHSVSISRDDVGPLPTFTSDGIGPLNEGEVLTATATDALNNTSEFSACFDPAAETTVTLALTADASVEAGARRVRYRDVPLSVFTRPPADEGQTESAPLDAIPLDAIPLDAIPLDAIPLDAIPLDAIGLSSALLNDALGGVPLTLVPLNPVRVPGGWEALLAGTELAGRPAVTLTLSQVFALNPLPMKPDGTALSLADLDLASSPLGDLPLVALLLGPVELEDIPIGENGVADWCSALDAQDGFACSDPSTLAGTSLMSVALRGLPLDAIPLDAIPLDAIPLDAIGVENLPLDAIPLDAILLKGTPLDAIPLDAILLQGTPLDAIPLDAIPLDAIGPGNVPLDAIPLDAIPLDAILLAGSPLDAIPLDAIPLDAIGLGTLPLDAITAANIPLDAIVSCGGSFDCDAAGATLRDAYLAGALQSGATLGDLHGALAGFELGDLRIAGNAVPPEVAQYTLGDLKEYGDLTLGELLAYGDVTLGEILEHVEGLTIGDLLLALLSPEAYPWEKLSYERLDPARYALEADRVAYSGAFAITSDSGPVGVTVRAQLPAGFSYVGGSSTLQFVTVPIEGPPVSGIQVIDDPEIEGQTLTFTFDSIARGTNYTVRVEARPTIDIGIGAASATAQPVGGEETAPDAAETSVTETFPENDDPDESPTLAADSYYLSHVTSGEDIDYFSFPMPEAGSRVKVMLSHLDADFDLAVYGPDGEVPRDPDAAAAPLDAIPLADEELGLRQSTSALTPEALQDVPLLRDRALWGLSINRKTEDESVLIASSGESGDLTLQVSGYNRASSATPYMLRVQVLEPRVLPPCTPRELPAATAGTMPTLPTGLNTVFLVNEQRLRATYADAEQALTALQQNLAALNSLGFPSAVVPVEADAAVAQAYSDWDLQPCSPHKANAVVRSVTEVVDGIRAAHPTLKYVVLVGGDDIVPHARVDDATSYANEIQHAGTFPTNNQYLGAFGNFKLLTDNPYGATEAIPFFNRHLYVPELAVGRLVEKPAEIARAIQKFVEFEGSLAPETAFTTGYNFLGDGADAIHGALEQLLGAGATSLISEDWTSGDILTALRSGTPPSIASINAHYDHHRSLPANENAAGTEDDLFTTADLRDPATPMLDRRLFFTMGCHAGLSLSDVVVGTTVPNGDWAQALAEKGAVFAGNTGFGYGDTDTVGYTEQLLKLFAEELPQAATIGHALNFAKQRYVASLGVVGVYDEKVISQMTLYGLPMYAVGDGVPPAPPTLPEPEAEPVSGLQATSFSTGELVFTRQTGDNGQYDTVAGGDLQVTHLRPLQPRLHLPVRPGARGALITHLESEDSTDAFDPSQSRPIVDHSSREPELDFDDVAFPTKIQTITHGPATEASLVLIPGQFFTTDASEPGRGIQRRFTSIEGLVYGDGTGDGAAPELLRIDGAILGSQASFTVDVTDAEGGPMDVKRVLVLYKDGLEWRSADLTRSATAPSIWSGGGPVSGDQISFFVQAVEEGGFVAASTLKGRYHQAVPPAGAADWLTTTLTGTQGDDGWYLSAVGVDLQGPGGTLTVSVDGGPVQAYAGAFTVSGDGIHRVDVRAPDGRETSFTVPIDTSDPTVSITSPAVGAVLVHGSTVDAVFACSDAGSGITSCTASSDPVDTTTAGPRSLTVTATDAAGNSAAAQVSYTVVHPDILFSSSRTGFGDIYAVSSDVPIFAPRQLTSGPAIDAEPDWFPGRQRFVFTRVVSGNVEIYATDTDGTDLVRLTNNNAVDTSPAVSPDGTKIAFASNRGGNWDIYVMDAANGANVKRLTTHKEVDALPAWSPNGLSIAFSSGRSGDGDIYRMTATGGSQTRVTSAARIDTEPTWVGTAIVFSSNRDGSFDLYRIPAGGGATTRLTTEAGHHVTPSASSDGSRILFASNRPGGSFDFNLYTMNADGTNPTPLVVHPAIDAFPEW